VFEGDLTAWVETFDDESSHTGDGDIDRLQSQLRDAITARPQRRPPNILHIYSVTHNCHEWFASENSEASCQFNLARKLELKLASTEMQWEKWKNYGYVSKTRVDNVAWLQNSVTAPIFFCFVGALKMTDMNMTDHRNVQAWNWRTWNWRTWKWRTIIIPMIIKIFIHHKS